MPTVSSSTPTTTFPRTVPNNIIVASNNHPNIQPNRLKSTILPPRSTISSPTPTSINSIPTSVNQPTISTATIVPGPRQVQVLPTNSLSTNETNLIQPTQVGTIQISSNDHRQVRTLPHPQQTTTTTTPPPPPPSSPSTNPSPTSTNVQVRTPTLQRNPSQTTTIPTLEVRTQFPTSPKPQQPPARPPSTTPRPPSVSQSSIDYVIQTQPKTLTTTTTNNPQSTLPVAVVRPIQHPTTTVTPSVSSSPTPTSPLNLPSMNVTLPTNKITSTTIPQQLRPTTSAATTFVPNANHSTSQITTISPQIRQLLPTTPNNPQTTTVTNTTTQRLTDASQRPPNSIQHFVTNRTATIPGNLRNVRIVTFTPGTSPSTNLSDSTTTVNTQQTSLQSANITYNRTNSATTTFPRSTINHDQDISPDVAAQLHRLKSLSGVSNTDTNDSTPAPRAVLIPAQTISSSSASSVSSINSASKLKPSAIIDPSTLGLTAKTSQANIVLQLPSSTGGDDQSNSGTNSTGLTRQNLLQHFNLIPSSLNQRSQSPTTAATLARLFQQYQIRTASNASNTQISSIRQATNEQQASSSSPPPPPPPSSSTT